MGMGSHFSCPWCLEGNDHHACSTVVAGYTMPSDPELRRRVHRGSVDSILLVIRSHESFQPTRISVQFSSVVQLFSCVRLFATPWTAALQASVSVTNSQSLLKFMSIVSVMPSNHLILCHPLHLPPSIFPSIRLFSNDSIICIRWPKYRSFSFSISPPNEYSGLISFRIDWQDLLAVQGTLKSLLQHHSSKA